MKRATEHFGGWFDDLVKAATTPSSITLSQQNPVQEVPATETFFNQNSGLVIGGIVLLVMGGTFFVMSQMNKNKKA